MSSSLPASYAASLTLRQNATKALRGGLGKLEPMPPEWTYFNRLRFGFYSVLARLDVAADYDAIERQLVGAPPRS